MRGNVFFFSPAAPSPTSYFFLSVGDDNDRESSPFLSIDTDQEEYYEDRNMALFEVPVTGVPGPPGASSCPDPG